jgi:hypothetical protein
MNPRQVLDAAEARPRMTVMSKEAHARIKINKLLEAAGWRFFDNEQGKANIALEANSNYRSMQAKDKSAIDRVWSGT